jgi:hypothetical protein
MVKRRRTVPGPPMTLGSATAATVFRFRAWCKDCHHEVEIDPAPMAERYGAALSVEAWSKRLVCRCGTSTWS